MFEVTTDGSLNSNLFLDDVSMSSSSMAMEEELGCRGVLPGSAPEQVGARFYHETLWAAGGLFVGQNILRLRKV